MIIDKYKNNYDILINANALNVYSFNYFTIKWSWASKYIMVKLNLYKNIWCLAKNLNYDIPDDELAEGIYICPMFQSGSLYCTLESLKKGI